MTAQTPQGAHSAPQRQQRGANGPPQANAGGLAQSPGLIAAPAQPAQGAHGAPRRERRGAQGSPQADAGGLGRSPI